MKTRNVVIADDHPLLLKGLKESLEQAGFVIKAAVTSGKEALAAIEKYQPCMAVLDISMSAPDGLAVAAEARANGWKTALVLLSLYDTPAYIAKAKQIPVDGYILKENATQDVVRALEEILKGGSYFDQRIDDAYRTEVSPLLHKLAGLSPSEKKILLRIAKGERIAEIAEACFISTRTVEKHRENIRRKLDIETKNGQMLDRWAEEHLELIKGC